VATICAANAPRFSVWEARGLRRLAVVGLDERGVAKALLGDGGDRAGAPALLARRRLDAGGEVARRQREQWRGDQRGERELPVQVEQESAEDQDLEAVGDHLHHPGQHQLLDRIHVAGEPRHQVAELAALEEPERHAVQVTEQSRPQGEDEPFPDPGAQVVVDERQQAHEHRDADVGRGHQREQ
jgi:hypothetical protein